MIIKLTNKFLISIKEKGVVQTIIITSRYFINQLSYIDNLFGKFYIYRATKYKLFPKYKNYLIFNNLSEKSIFIDLGANVGEVSQYIFDNYKSNIYAYEPNIYAYKILRKKFFNNKKVRVFNKAISNYSGEGNLYMHKLFTTENKERFSQASSLFINKKNIDKDKNFKIEVVSIKNLIAKFNMIDIIKIDIEGAEFKILPEIINQKKKIKKVVCEMHKNVSVNKYNKFYKLFKKQKLLNKWIYLWI